MPNLSVYGVVIVAALLIGGFFVFGSGNFQFSINPVDPFCSDGGSASLLVPEYRRYDCEATTNEITIKDETSCGLFNLNRCVEIACNYGDIIEGRDCQVQIQTAGLSVDQGFPGLKIADGAEFIPQCAFDGCTFRQGETFTLVSGGKATLEDKTMTLKLSYPSKELVYREETTGKRILVGSGCDLASSLGSEEFGKLPEDQRTTMSVGESINSVLRWDTRPWVGNYIEWEGQDAVCEKLGPNTATIYSIGKYDAKDGCYLYPESEIDRSQCCNGEETDQSRCVNGAWEDKTAISGCCQGGICSDLQCPGNGEWIYDLNNEVRERYGQCNENTGQCQKIESQSIKCEPGTNRGCVGQEAFCDPISLTCVTQPKPSYTCTEWGNECCIEGQVPENVQSKSCVQAGYSSDWTCVDGFCREPGTVPPGMSGSGFDFNFIILLVVALGIIGIIGIGIVKAFRGRK